MIIGISLVITSCQKAEIERVSSSASDDYVVLFQQTNPIIEGSYIVRLQPDVIPSSKFKMGMTYDEKAQVVQETVVELEREITGTASPIYQTYHATILGFAGELTEQMADRLRSDPRVLSIEPDRAIALAPPPGKGKDKGDNGGGGTDPDQIVPWGIARVNGTTYSGNRRAWIIDTGIDLDHNDLNVNSTGLNKSFLVGVKGGKSPDDQYGHGTHVAGIIGAVDNTIGTVGVAAGVEVVSVRVLDATGSGRYSGIIAGVDYVGANASPGDVANMSLGSSIYPSLDAAVVRAAASGIRFVLAAGNNAADANIHSPARVNGDYIYTVSAMRQGDLWASFSNYGNPPIDYCEPGVSIFSCWKNGGYATASGTSMSAPHLSGLLLLGGVSTDGTVLNDPDANPDPIGVH